MKYEKIMKLLIQKAIKTKKETQSTCYIAAIVKDNKIISICRNTTTYDNNPLAHAEINAITEATKKLKSLSLKNCILYSTCEPCAMCFTAAWWAKIPKIVYGISVSNKYNCSKEIEIPLNYLNKKGGNKIKIKKGVLKKDIEKIFKDKYKIDSKFI